MLTALTAKSFTILAKIVLVALVFCSASASGGAAVSVIMTSAAATSGDKFRDQHASIGYSLGNTGYVFVSGHGHQGSEMLFCEPTVGNYQFGSGTARPHNVIKKGKCWSRVLLGSWVEHKALSAEQYVDELIGEGMVEVVGVAPAIIRNRLYAVIYYKSLEHK